jgi:hypothetical protein
MKEEAPRVGRASAMLAERLYLATIVGLFIVLAVIIQLVTH